LPAAAALKEWITFSLVEKASLWAKVMLIRPIALGSSLGLLNLMSGFL
jgi:uncharacterized protein (DUF983 family)